MARTKSCVKRRTSPPSEHAELNATWFKAIEFDDARTGEEVITRAQAREISKACDEWLRKRGLPTGIRRLAYGKGKN